METSTGGIKGLLRVLKFPPENQLLGKIILCCYNSNDEIMSTITSCRAQGNILLLEVNSRHVRYIHVPSDTTFIDGQYRGTLETKSYYYPCTVEFVDGHLSKEGEGDE